MTLGQNICRLRTERGLSQGDLADALEVSRQSISKWETDASVPELEKLLRLSELFHITLDELVKETPLGRLGTPEDIAYAVAFFASERAGFITGQVLTADGGFIV